MKITCPSCAADYNVPGTLASGRIVRCAKCGTEWSPVPASPPEIDASAPAPAPAEPVPPPPAPEPTARLVPPVPEPEHRTAPLLLLAWVGSGLILVAAVVSAVLFRAPIMEKWPPSQRVYGVLGLLPAASPHVDGDVVK